MMFKAINKLKILITFILVFALVSSCALLQGCSPTRKTESEVIYESVDERLSAIKDRDPATIQRFSDVMDLEELRQFGVDPTSFARKFLQGFDYKITSVDVSGNTANVTAEVYVRSFSEYEQALQKKIEKYLKDGGSITLKDKTLEQAYGDMIEAALNAIPITSVGSVSIRFNKEGNTWKPAPTMLIDISNAIISH